MTHKEEKCSFREKSGNLRIVSAFRSDASSRKWRALRVNFKGRQTYAAQSFRLQIEIGHIVSGIPKTALT